MALDVQMPVLVVDDYKTMIRIIRNLLKQLGFEDIDDAADGTEALEKMKQRRYGLVISDWNMEPMTGYELLKQVRADAGLCKTPFIMVTAESKTERDRCEEGRREQLHREAVQRTDAEGQDRGRVRRLTGSCRQRTICASGGGAAGEWGKCVSSGAQGILRADGTGQACPACGPERQERVSWALSEKKTLRA